jgi:hypothetical protein
VLVTRRACPRRLCGSRAEIKFDLGRAHAWEEVAHTKSEYVARYWQMATRRLGSGTDDEVPMWRATQPLGTLGCISTQNNVDLSRIWWDATAFWKASSSTVARMEEKRRKESGRTVSTLVFSRTWSFWKSLRERFWCKILRENVFARLRSVKVVPSLWERGSSLICPQKSSDAPPFLSHRQPTFSSTSPSHPKARDHSQWFDLLEVLA